MDIGAQLKEKRGLLMESKTLLDFLVNVFTEKDCDKESAIASSPRLFPCEKMQDILEAIDRCYFAIDVGSSRVVRPCGDLGKPSGQSNPSFRSASSAAHFSAFFVLPSLPLPCSLPAT